MVLKLALEGKSTKQIDEAIADFLQKNGLKREMSTQIQKQAEQEWMALHLLNDTERKVAEKIVRLTGNQFARVDNKIRTSVVDAVEISRRKNE